MGVSYRGYLGEHEILIRGGPGVTGGDGGELATARETSIGRSQHQQPVMVKTIELKERVNKDKVKIRSVNEIQHELSFDVCIFYIYSFTF